MDELNAGTPATQAPAGADRDAKLAKKLRGHWEEARKAARTERHDAQEDRAFYDGEQWKASQKAILEKDGRAPIVINKIFKAVNNMIGREINNRLDWKARPRGASDVQTADAMTKALAYEDDTKGMTDAFSEAFRDAAKGPRGFFEMGIEAVKGVDEVFLRHLPWSDVWTDPFSKARDLSDARYVIIARMLDLDLALAAWPKFADKIRAAIEADARAKEGGQEYRDRDDYGNLSTGAAGLAELREDDVCDAERKRVRIRQHEWWENEESEFLVMPDGRTWVWAEALQLPHLLDLLSQGGRRRQGTRRVYYRALVVGDTILDSRPSDYPFEGFSVLPVRAYVSENGLHFGAIRMMKDPQRERNVARSRANESARAKGVRYRPGALGDLTEAEVIRRIRKPNYVLPVADPSGVQIDTEKSDVSLWVNMQQMADAEIDEVAGQNEASYGDRGNEKSAKAIQARVAQQGQTVAELFDNLRFARRVAGTRVLALMQKYYEPERLARIVEASELRAGKPVDLSWLEGALYANPIEQMEFDVIIEDQAETSSERSAALDQGIQLVGMLPDPAKAAIAPHLIRMSDFGDKDEMAQAAERAMAPPMPPGLPPGLPLPPGAGAPPLPPGVMPPAPVGGAPLQ